MAAEPVSRARGTLRGVADWAVAARPLPGERASGDHHLVVSRPDGAFLAVIDGLGHGEEAARVAAAAVEVLERAAHEPLAVMLDLCDRALAGSRGVVLSAAVVDSRRSTLRWLGIGDVAGVLLGRFEASWKPRARLVTRCGIVGNQAPSLWPTSQVIAAGDVLVFATDGIRGEFSDQLPGSSSAHGLAEHILTHHAKQTDDALVLAARLCCGA